MVLFRKPSWLKPNDINTTRYWIKMTVLIVIVLALLQFMHLASLSFWGVIIAAPAFILADIVSATLMK